MELEITLTPRETLVWAARTEEARELRHELTESGYLVRGADPFELTNCDLPKWLGVLASMKAQHVRPGP